MVLWTLCGHMEKVGGNTDEDTLMRTRIPGREFGVARKQSIHCLLPLVLLRTYSGGMETST